MTMIPIFIHIKEKSDKELREEMKQEARWRKIMEEDEAREARRAEEERLRAEERRKVAEHKYFEDCCKDPWDYQFVPEGWSLLGQTYIPVICETDLGFIYSRKDD